jgi:hypothetical protein
MILCVFFGFLSLTYVRCLFDVKIVERLDPPDTAIFDLDQFCAILLKSILKGLSHEICRSVFWTVWMHLGLNVNCL